jgi:glycosyltransferase involved in cell wall biosynthesis
VDKPKIAWMTPEREMIGNALGYASHNRFMRKYSDKYFEFCDDAGIALQIVSADHFIPVPGKINVLFTMWEFLQLPDSYIKAIAKVDALIVPSTFCRDLFRRYTDKPIYVCHEGIEPATYPFFDRSKHPAKRFRFLWLGASNYRKGYPFVLEAIKFFEKVENVEIYLKTTAEKLNWIEVAKNTWKYRKHIFARDNREKWFMALWRSIQRIPKPHYANQLKVLGKYKNIFYDTRKLSLDELRDLYNSAHCFLLPTMGEGWGLTLTEAMATGCPSIATETTGCKDFFDGEVGYPIKYKIQTLDLENYYMKADAYVPDTQDFVQTMINVIANYPEALRRGKKASERIHRKFTWDKSAARLRDIIKEIYEAHGA